MNFFYLNCVLNETLFAKPLIEKWIQIFKFAFEQKPKDYFEESCWVVKINNFDICSQKSEQNVNKIWCDDRVLTIQFDFVCIFFIY